MLIADKNNSVEWNDVRRPEKEVLEGRYVSLEPLALSHAGDLYEVFSQRKKEERYLYLPAFPPASEEDVRGFIQEFLANDAFLFFAVVNKATKKAEGHFALMRIDEKNGVAEIGWVLWGASLARTRRATEAVFLAADYIFSLGYRRLEWKCDNLNEASKRAAQRFGFQFEGIFRQHLVVKGKNRDTAWFSILDKDWPALREEYERWLSPRNFDLEGAAEKPFNVLMAYLCGFSYLIFCQRKASFFCERF
ncbi:GNAT family N-acetyltransferase [Acetobacteraceae bacterium]|nr:GNAT family N-acetyltransferase [Acetobacteraceae bacterium]